MRGWVHPAWKVLGIEPTSDTRAIRTAYSALLKAIDPETDPKAFIELREAFEAAKIQAQWVDQADEDEDEAAWDEEVWDGDGEDWVPSGDLYQIRPSGHVPTPPPPDPAWETPAPPEAAAPADEALPEIPDPAWETPAPPEPPASSASSAPPEPADTDWQAPTPPEPPERPSPWATISPEAADAHARSLATLLYSHDREALPWPSQAQEDEMLAHWRALIADPRMQELSYFADAERWFSELIARTAAFSDPLVIPATEYFGWLGGDGTITQTPAIAWLTRRYRMLEFQRSVKQPGHPLHPAWNELVRPAGPRPRRGSVNGRKVRQLLRIVRSHYPDLEGCFDPARVALWDGTVKDGAASRPFFRWGCTSIWVLFILGLIAIATFGDRIAPPHPAPALENARPDIDVALEKLFGDKLSINLVENENAALAKALMAFWAEERERHATRSDFTAHLDRFLAVWHRRGVPKSDPALLADYHRFQIDVAKALLAADPDACQAYLSGQSVAWDNRNYLPAALLDRERALRARVLLTTDGSTGEIEKRSTVPGALVEAAARHAHVSHEAMTQSLVFEGPRRDQCVNRIAFEETVLALPAGKQRTELMRHM